jgi:predicted DsbA family dithiol-disulfide isomerase
MKVDVYVDVVCPWSYLGKRRLEAALAGFAGKESVEVEWKPFQLDPGAALPEDEFASAAAGPSAEVREHVTAIAAAEGVTLDLAASVTAPTFDAHRLLWWAREQGGAPAQSALAERLFTAQLATGKDLSDHAALAAASGLPGAAEFLASGAGTDEVKEAIGEARAMGIESVPTFVFEERWAVTGAQPADVLAEILGEVADASIEARAGGGGGCCGGGCCG